MRITRVAREQTRRDESGRSSVAKFDEEGAFMHPICVCMMVRARRYRHDLVEQVADPRDNSRSALHVVRPFESAVTQDVGSVHGVVERTPSGIRGVQCVARVHDRHDELRAGNGRDLCIDVARVNRERSAFRHQIPDFFEKPSIGSFIQSLPGACSVPAVNGCL